jgi:uncharacterized protein YbjT (DUF2867 family)
MRSVIIGGIGLIGSKLVRTLQEHGNEAMPAGPNTGVNAITGEGLAEALDSADVVIDVSNPPSFEEKAVMSFFETSTRTLLAAEAAAGVRHHVVLSAVGTERLSESAYFRARIVQEYLVQHSGIPYSIVRATQSFEFIKNIVDAATVGTTVRLAPVRFRPMASEDVAEKVGRISVGPPVNGVVEIAGPEEFWLDGVVRDGLRARQDLREVITDPEARYFGARLNERTLVPGDGARLGEIRLDEWRGEVARLAGKPPRQEPASAISFVAAE